jgi:hypothetical protein
MNQGNTKITARFDDESTFFDIVEYGHIWLGYIQSCIEIFKDFDKSIVKLAKTSLQLYFFLIIKRSVN